MFLEINSSFYSTASEDQSSQHILSELHPYPKCTLHLTKTAKKQKITLAILTDTPEKIKLSVSKTRGTPRGLICRLCQPLLKLFFSPLFA